MAVEGCKWGPLESQLTATYSNDPPLPFIISRYEWGLEVGWESGWKVAKLIYSFLNNPGGTVGSQLLGNFYSVFLVYSLSSPFQGH